MAYNIKYKYIKGADIIALDIEDEKGKIINVSYDTACELASTNELIGYTLVKYRQERWIKGTSDKYSLKNVPTNKKKYSSKFKAVQKVKNSKGDTVGYIVEDENHKRLKLSNAKLWQLSKDGLIDNIKPTISIEQKTKTIEEV